jgi:hypothetical protein
MAVKLENILTLRSSTLTIRFNTYCSAIHLRVTCPGICATFQCTVPGYVGGACFGLIEIDVNLHRRGGVPTHLPSGTPASTATISSS